MDDVLSSHRDEDVFVGRSWATFFSRIINVGISTYAGSRRNPQAKNSTCCARPVYSDITSTQEPVLNSTFVTSARSKLKMLTNPKQKDPIKKLLQSQTSSTQKVATMEDIVRGKDKSLVMLLHGPPGVGKPGRQKASLR
jgi:flagellar biosynthesis GTPase FlhF